MTLKSIILELIYDIYLFFFDVNQFDQVNYNLILFLLHSMFWGAFWSQHISFCVQLVIRLILNRKVAIYSLTIHIEYTFSVDIIRQCIYCVLFWFCSFHYILLLSWDSSSIYYSNNCALFLVASTQRRTILGSCMSIFTHNILSVLSISLYFILDCIISM